jgi:hypothetical protein
MGDDSGKFDAVQFGRLIQAVETLTVTIRDLQIDVSSLKETRSRGWGILAGVTLAAGSAGSAIHSIAEKLLK